MELCGSTSAICLTNPAEPPVRECHARPSVPYGIPLNERRPRGRRHNSRGPWGSSVLRREPSYNLAQPISFVR